MCHPVGLEDADGGLEAEGACYYAEGAGDYESCLESSFGECLILREWTYLCFEKSIMILEFGDLGEWKELDG